MTQLGLYMKYKVNKLFNHFIRHFIKKNKKFRQEMKFKAIKKNE